MPERIQLRRTKGWHKPEGAVVVSRPSIYGNPFTIKWIIDNTDVCDQDDARAMAVRWYRRWLDIDPLMWNRSSERRLILDRLHELRGRDLACWCPLKDAYGNRVPCHADVLLELANPGWKP